MTVTERYRVDEAASYMGVSESYLNTLRSSGGGPLFLKIGRSVRYEKSDLDAWLSERKRRSTADTGRAA